MSSGDLKKYAPDDVACTVGSQIISGFKEGTWVEVEKDVDTATIDVGADGEATLIISPNKMGRVKFVLQQASPSNDYLTSLHVALQNKQTSQAVKNINIEDKNGTTVCSGKQSIVQKPAKVSFADKGEGREWTLLVPYINMTVGGAVSV